MQKKNIGITSEPGQGNRVSFLREDQEIKKLQSSRTFERCSITVYGDILGNNMLKAGLSDAEHCLHCNYITIML